MTKFRKIDAERLIMKEVKLICNLQKKMLLPHSTYKKAHRLLENFKEWSLHSQPYSTITILEITYLHL
jgi:hypothetical protein